MIESLYFSCYYAYLLGDLNKTKMYFSLLREEFKTHGTRNSLKDHQLSELKKIKDALITGNISRNKWLEDPIFLKSYNLPAVEINQKKLVRKIHFQGLAQLKALLDDDINLYNIEHPCSPYGTVDMVYMGKSTIYPVEVKRDKGEHDLIGQISKYDLAHKLQLHYRHYKHVQSITICRAYNPYVVSELKQMGILILKYTITDKLLLKVV